MAVRLSLGKDNDSTEDAYPDTGRIEAFSDGVFAVAITLLVFNIRLPELRSGGQLGEQLLTQWTSYAAYVVSFVTVGIFWANHHHMFHFIKGSNHLLAMVNVLFLMCISFLPFSTSLAAAFVRSPGSRRTAVLVYVGTFLSSALLFTAVWLFAVWQRLIEQYLDSSAVRIMTRKYFSGVVSYFIAFATAFWSTTISLVIVVGVALLFFLPPSQFPRRSCG